MHTEYTVVTSSDFGEGCTEVGPYVSRAEAERAMTRVAEQGFSVNGKREAFARVTLREREVEGQRV